MGGYRRRAHRRGGGVLQFQSTRAANRAARAADEQTKIQQQLRIEAAQPYVWADVRGDEATGHC